MKPRGVPVGAVAHVAAEIGEFGPRPRGHLGRVRVRVARYCADEEDVLFVLHPAAGRVFGTINERGSGGEVAGDAHLLAESSATGLNGQLPFPRVAATGVGPRQRPEPLAGAALLNQ